MAYRMVWQGSAENRRHVKRFMPQCDEVSGESTTVAPEKCVVLMLNDHPLGVYTTGALADAAALADWKKRESRWKECGLTVGQSCVDRWTKDPVRFTKYHYRNCEFTVDGEAQG